MNDEGSGGGGSVWLPGFTQYLDVVVHDASCTIRVEADGQQPCLTSTLGTEDQMHLLEFDLCGAAKRYANTDVMEVIFEDEGRTRRWRIRVSDQRS